MALFLFVCCSSFPNLYDLLCLFVSLLDPLSDSITHFTFSDFIFLSLISTIVFGKCMN